jgi:hypothetical protein
LSRNKERILPKKREWYKFNREAELERGRKYKEQTRDKRRAARKLMTEAAREHKRVLVRARYRRRREQILHKLSDSRSQYHKGFCYIRTRDVEAGLGNLIRSICIYLVVYLANLPDSTQ